MSKASENAEVIRRGYAAFNASDIEALNEIFDVNASWHTPGKSSIAGDNVGRDAVFEQFGKYVGQTGGTFKATLQHVLGGDNGRVIGVHQAASVTANASTSPAASSSRSKGARS